MFSAVTLEGGLGQAGGEALQVADLERVATVTGEAGVVGVEEGVVGVTATEIF